ncbi:unnamed protein product [Hydatigera taeniaeformis]|uniref:ZM domain-containing protein n=1 Tax=Hydatigena taeniaeformis TaxID=6205 RepID=A0A0R3WMV8_HYDTA|nr:unnamed protein product [Hydatigera taeniaeformis]
MASPQPTQEQSPKVYLRNDVFRPAVPDVSYTAPYGKAPITYKAGDTIVYSRQPATVPRQVYPTMGSVEAPYYVDESTLRSGTYSDLSNYSKGKNPKSSQRSHHRYHHHHHRGQRIEDPDGYWRVPHANSQEKLQSTLPGPYVTPGGRQLSKTPKQHTAGVQIYDVNQTVSEKSDQNPSYADLTQESEEYMQSSQYLPSEDSEMTVSLLALTAPLKGILILLRYIVPYSIHQSCITTRSFYDTCSNLETFFLFDNLPTAASQQTNEEILIPDIKTTFIKSDLTPKSV